MLLKFERIPEFEYMLAGDYTWNVGRDGNIIYRIQYAYRDGFPTNLANFPERFIDSYGILDMGLRYEQGGLRVALWGRNLGEENYGDIISSALNQHLFGGQAESFGVEVSWDF